MKKKILLLAITTVLVSGCGDKSEAELAHERRVELLRIQQNHELAMARIENSQITTTSGTVSHEQPNVSYSEVEQSEFSSQHVTTDGSAVSSDTGFSGGSMVAATMAGMAAGYVANELLDSGYRSGTDSSGRIRYYDSAGKEITQSQYQDHKTKHPIKSKAREVTNAGRAKTSELATKGRNKAAAASKAISQKVSQTKASKPFQSKKTSSPKVSSSKRR